MSINFLSMLKYSHLFVSGLLMTLKLTFLAVTIGVILGLIVALIKMSSIKPISFVGASYVEIIRGTPLLVQLLLIYNGLMQFGIDIPAFIAGVSALAINSAAYVAEIIRAGIQAVDPGQNEAARSLGMTHTMAMRYVIIPQAIKNILPALGNEFIVMLKESAIVSVIGFADLTRQADIIQSVTYKYFEPYIIIAAIYFIMTFIFSRLLWIFERSSEPVIRVNEVYKTFGNLEVLKGVSLSVNKGEVVVIIGPSGSGKSTLLRCINLLEVPTRGEIYIEGIKINDRKVNINKIRQKVGMVFQHFNLFPHLTALENVTLAPIKVKRMDKKTAENIALGLLEKVGLLDKKDEYPIKLSGGQKQRLAIARALAMQPDIMLFDEPHQP